MSTQPPFFPTRPAAGAESAASPSPAAHRPVAPSRITVAGDSGVKIVRAVTIRRPADELYAFWRDPENLPRIVKHPVEIRRISELESHWRVSAPLGGHHYEWDALIINDEPGRLIAWRSREGAEVDNAGTVRFEPAPGDEGTEVTVALEYNPPGGKLGAWLAKLSPEEPGRQVQEALRHFKALVEAGEIPTIRGQAVGAPRSERAHREERP